MGWFDNFFSSTSCDRVSPDSSDYSVEICTQNDFFEAQGVSECHVSFADEAILNSAGKETFKNNCKINSDGSAVIVDEFVDGGGRRLLQSVVDGKNVESVLCETVSSQCSEHYFDSTGTKLVARDYIIDFETGVCIALKKNYSGQFWDVSPSGTHILSKLTKADGVNFFLLTSIATGDVTEYQISNSQIFKDMTGNVPQKWLPLLVWGKNSNNEDTLVAFNKQRFD